MKILIAVQHRLALWNVPSWFRERLAEQFSGLDIIQRNTYEGIEEPLQDAEILFTLSLRSQQFAAARKLRWIHSPSAAVHQFLFPELIDSAVVLTNSSEVHGPVVAEHVMALIFALAKKIPQAAVLQQSRTWGQEAMWNEGSHLQEISGATLGLIGLGSIGTRVAKMAAAMGMRVLATRQHPEKTKPEEVTAVYPTAALDEMLGQSDFVVLAAPLTPTTQKFINADRLAAMKPSAYLINVGRGSQIDDTALVQALSRRQIAGAALDVFEREPLPPDSPLWSAPNLLITPHTAGLTPHLWDRHYDLFSANLQRYLTGQPLLDVVDKRKGY